MIKANGITKSFGKKTVLDGIDLEIHKGEIFGLIGPSGAGKTTLIKILTGQLCQDGGYAYTLGKDSRNLTGDDHSRLGMMMDDLGVYDRLSCFENLKVFARLSGTKDTMIYDVLRRVGLDSAAKTPAGRLSKGMKNRLRLARAFMTDPDILFLDEPTSGLDPASAEEIHKMIAAEKDRGKAVFLTTHTMSEAEKLCGNIAMLCDGHIVERGAPEEICRRYDSEKMIRIHLKNGRDEILHHSADNAEKLCTLVKSGMTESIHTTEPDLCSVFMKLTGKEIPA